jgi:hypothetical protein
MTTAVTHQPHRLKMKRVAAAAPGAIPPTTTHRPHTNGRNRAVRPATFTSRLKMRTTKVPFRSMYSSPLKLPETPHPILKSPMSLFP